MRYIRRYNESVTIKATDGTIRKILSSEIDKLGWNADLNHIDVSGVTKMDYLFSNSSFDGDISGWNVGNVQNMDAMFFSSPFNGDISQWNVQNVLHMHSMFSYSNFNRDISNWNVQNVQYMSYMFYDTQFNGDLSRWNVQNVWYMGYMFQNSPLEGREPWWYILLNEFTNKKSMYQSIEVHEWINLEKGIIWKKRLNYALQDFGKEDFKIPKSIWGFTIQ